MGYQSALEAAGADVLAFEQFGSYQGDWLAKVRVDGVEGWIRGAYGSCSGCDAFEGEFGYQGHYHGALGEPDRTYVSDYADTLTPETCAVCLDIKRRFAEFGKSYLDDVLTQEQVEAMADEHSSWDCDAKAIQAFVKANALPVAC